MPSAQINQALATSPRFGMRYAGRLAPMERQLEPPHSAARAKTVLLVDDNEDVQRILPEALSAKGYRVLQARNGVEGLTLARRERPDLIIMDAAMPVLGGWDATRIIKLDRDTAAIPVLAFTASEINPRHIQALYESSDGILRKPSTPTEVLAEVRQWIGPAAVRD